MKIIGMISCEQCGNYIDGMCNDSDLNTRLDYNKYGVSIGKRCSKFLAKRQRNNRVSLDKALEFILAGTQEFVMVSGNTGKKLRYLVEKKTTPLDKDGDTTDIYWVHCEGRSGVLEYAGTVYKDKIDETYKFSQGNRGRFNKSTLEIRSLLFVLNKLNSKVYSMPLTIENLNSFEKED